MFLIWNMLRDHLIGSLRQVLPKANKLPGLRAIKIHLHATNSQAFLLLYAALKYGFWSVTINNLVTTSFPAQKSTLLFIYCCWIFPAAPFGKQSSVLVRETIHIPSLRSLHFPPWILLGAKS